MVASLLDPIELRPGKIAPNRIWLAPLTNQQSHADGTLADEELHFLAMRADGGFGLIETCAAYVTEDGKAWLGELGVHDDAMVPGLRRLADRIHQPPREAPASGHALLCAQLFHGGLRADPTVSGLPTWSASAGTPSSPSSPREATEDDLRRVVRAFADAARRCAEAGFDAVELHGAHGYLLGQFLSTTDNRRTDRWGGSLENRARLLREVLRAVRATVPSLAVAVRLSPEDFGQARGLDLDESLQIASWLRDDGMDVLHLSLWRASLDTTKRPGSHATPLFRAAVGDGVRIVVAGGIWTREDAEAQLARGADAVALGRAAIANHDWPRRAHRPEIPVGEGSPGEGPAIQRPPLAARTLRAEGLSPRFVEYMRRWKDFVAPTVLPRLAALEKGEGDEVVMLLHSSGSSSRQWRRLVDTLAKGRRVLAADLLGSGDNPAWPDEEPFDVAQDRAALLARIEEVGTRVHLVGHSYGGFLALSLARLHPDRVASVAVYDPVAFGVLFDARDEEGLADLDRAKRDPQFTEQATGGGEAWFERFVDYWNGDGAWKALPAVTREQFLRVGRKVYQEVMGLLTDRTTRADWATISVPTLLLGGEQSPAAAKRVLAQLEASIPGARRVTVEGAGHMGPITHAQRVNAAILEHLDAATSAGTS